MANKKSAIEVQFNWLFVLIVGAVILIVFIGFAVKQKNVSEGLKSATVVNSLNAIITSVQSSKGEVSYVSIPKEKINFECNKISVGTASRQYENLILFSPREIESPKLITHTSSLNIPYRVSNLLFVTSPDVRYILIGNFKEDKLAEFVNENIPEEVNKDIFYSPHQPGDKKIEDIADKKNQKVRFVLINDPDKVPNVPNVFRKMENGDVTKIKITGNKNSGSIEFYQKNDVNGWDLKKDELPYIKESLIGAIYSDDFKQYDCIMENIFKRVKMVTNVYNERTTKLSNEALLSRCRGLYDGSKTQLNKISASQFDEAGIQEINSATEILDGTPSAKGNNKKLQEKSCPLVY